MNQLLRWTGTDPIQLLALGVGSAKYQVVQTSAVLPGADGQAISLVLLWLIAFNVAVTTWLTHFRGSMSIALALFDLGMVCASRETSPLPV